MYVWKQILANRGKWTKAELEDSLWYINKERKKAGITEPLKIKYTEQQITEIAKKALKDIDREYYRENCIRSVVFSENDEVLDGSLKPTWTIFIKSLFDNEDHLIISDETGEPLYYQNFNYIITEIIKKDDGSYDYKD